MSENFSPKEIQTQIGLSDEEVEKILKEFEENGLCFKTWDIKKQDYVWHKTEFGRKVAKELNIE